MIKKSRKYKNMKGYRAVRECISNVKREAGDITKINREDTFYGTIFRLSTSSPAMLTARSMSCLFPNNRTDEWDLNGRQISFHMLTVLFLANFGLFEFGRLSNSLRHGTSLVKLGEVEVMGTPFVFR